MKVLHEWNAWSVERSFAVVKLVWASLLSTAEIINEPFFECSGQTIFSLSCSLQIFRFLLVKISITPSHEMSIACQPDLAFVLRYVTACQDMQTQALLDS